MPLTYPGCYCRHLLFSVRTRGFQIMRNAFFLPLARTINRALLGISLAHAVTATSVRTLFIRVVRRLPVD